MNTSMAPKKAEKLIIRGFAGMDEIILDARRFTVLIGPQASGKSITAKMLFFFRGIWTDLFYSADGDLSIESRKDYIKDQFRKYFPPEAWGKKVFVIEYQFGNHKILIRRAPSRGKPSDGLILHLPDFVEGLIDKAEQYLSDAASGIRNRSLGASRYEAWRKTSIELKAVLGSAFFSTQLFVPAGRAFFSNIENNVFSFISRSERKLDPFITQFGEYFTFLKSGGFRRLSNREFTSSLLTRLLGGTFIVDKDKEYVQTKDGRKISLGNLSSGQQEALPLLLMLDEGLGGVFSTGNVDIADSYSSYIEEPEAHLYPEFQKILIEVIVEYALSRPGNHNLFITTHSPYVLSTLNNLLYAGKLGEIHIKSKSKIQEIASIVPINRWIKSGDISVYLLENGTAKPLIDEEDGLINAAFLDSVSSAIAETFDDLLAVEFPSK